MVKYYYTYQIFINDSSSTLDGCYYFGKRESTLEPSKDIYWGSGVILDKYIKKHGTDKLQKTIINVFSCREELNNAEYELIEQKRKELGNLCLNRHEGGSGGHWVEYCSPEEYESRCEKVRAALQKKLTDEQRHTLAKNAALAKKNATPDQRAQWSKNQSQRHAQMLQEEKLRMYSQVSNSLKQYYKTISPEILEKKRLKNQQQNQEKSKAWRTEFFNIFHQTPEHFRSRGLMKESLELFRKFQQQGVDIKELQEFYEKFNNQEEHKVVYSKERNNKLREYQQNKRKKTSKYIYIIDGKEFYGESYAISYLKEKYGYKLYAQKLQKISEFPQRYIEKYPNLIDIKRKENIKNE